MVDGVLPMTAKIITVERLKWRAFKHSTLTDEMLKTKQKKPQN